MKKQKSFIPRLFSKIKSIFLNGLLTLLPVTLTFLLFRSMFRLIKSWVAPLHGLEPEVLKDIPHIEIILVLIFIFIFGAILKLFVLKPFVHLIEENLILRLPLIRPVYKGIKQLAHALTSHDKFALNQVVLVEFPSKGIHCLGFLTGTLATQISPVENETFYNIYVPTTPNPTTGYFIIVTKDKFKEVNITRQEAMTIIISGGIIQPDKFN